MLPVGGERSQHLCTVMDGMERPDDRPAVVQPVDPVIGKIAWEPKDESKQNWRKRPRLQNWRWHQTGDGRSHQRGYRHGAKNAKRGKPTCYQEKLKVNQVRMVQVDSHRNQPVPEVSSDPPDPPENPGRDQTDEQIPRCDDKMCCEEREVKVGESFLQGRPRYQIKSKPQRQPLVKAAVAAASALV